MKLGVDFGTTWTVVALREGGNTPVISFEDERGELHPGFPSVVAARGGELRYGFAALAAAAEGWEALPAFKRHLRTLEPIRLGGGEIAPLPLLAGFLGALREALLTASTLPEALRGEPLEAFIAVPAHASSAQRFLTLAAFRQAGFAVSGMLNEPSAAGVEYAVRYASTLNSKREKVLVYDLGGGTFDASLVQLASGGHAVLDSVGLATLGGEDFDALLAEMALETVNLREADLSPEGRVRLRLHCREVKERLASAARNISVELGACLTAADRAKAGLGEDAPCALKVADYDARCVPLVARTLDALQPLLAEGEDALAGIAGVYVVGGASALPAVGRALRDAFGRRVRRSLQPGGATAAGLALAFDAGPVAEPLSRGFGVFREADAGASAAFDLLFDSRQALGVESVRRYRPVHNIGHFRFVECTALKGAEPAGDITPFAELRFPFDPALRSNGADISRVPIRRTGGPGPLIEERYTLDASGVIALSITDLDSGYRQEKRLGGGV